MVKNNLPVGITGCADYEKKHVRSAMEDLLEQISGLDWLQSGMTVAIKTNLVSAAVPEKAVVTHPVVLTVLKWIGIVLGALIVILFVLRAYFMARRRRRAKQRRRAQRRRMN